MAALTAVACTKAEEGIQYHPSEPAGDGMTIIATLPASITVGLTKASGLSQKDGLLIPEWEEGSTLSVNGSTFTLKTSNGRTATFTGKKVEGNSFDIVYSPAGKNAAQLASMKFDGQKQTGNDNASHIEYYAMLAGVGNCSNISFSSEWATANGGIFRQSGCLKVKATLPDDVTSVKSIKISCQDKIFHSSNEESSACSSISIDLENAQVAADHSITAYIATPWFPISFADKQTLSFTVTDQGGDVTEKSFRPEAQVLQAGRVNEFTVGGNWPTGYKKGEGSPNNPYLIKTADDMCNIKDKLNLGMITCFRLENDIDMSSVSNWTPINLENAAYGIQFDGNGKTISNFKSGSTKYSSMFGVLHGTVKDLTFKNPNVTSSTGSPCGVLCAWAGNDNATLGATVENVNVIGGTVEFTGTSATIIGGLCGNACNSSFSHCSFEGNVNRSGKCSDVDNYVGTGGLIGKTLNKVSLKACHTAGTVYIAAGRANGGLVGYWTAVTSEGDIEGCYTTATVTSVNDCTGGLIGWFAGGVFKNNWADNATVNCGTKASGTYAYCGGLLGHSSAAIQLTDCHFTGKITGKGTLVAGIIGQAQNGTEIRRCWFDGSIVCTAGYVAGIAGRTGKFKGYEFTDCYTKGSIEGTNYVAGLVADAYENNNFRNCYSTCKIKGTYGVGGLIARASNAAGSTTLMNGVNYNTLVEGMIAWNESIETKTAGGETHNHYPCAPIVGYTAELNTLRNCWRRPDMVFNYYQDSAFNELYDQEDVDATHPLYRKFTEKYYFPYNGKAAKSGETISAVAKRIGWDESIWELSGPEPRLKEADPVI